ncbi:MAG TPA: two-component regulator propeller domain-containing protein [Chryseosolibacter sp.]|nr:two-component regulator propeller domain-containing protein [Chryseosolibacter sp.]
MLRLFFVLCALIAPSVAVAQTPYFQTYTFLKKHEAYQVNAIHQDNTGFLWVGSDKGLFRFDGIDIVPFTDANGLGGNNITAIASDSLNRIWVGYDNGLIDIIDNLKVSHFLPEEGNSNKPISAILFDNKGVLWFSTLNDGIYYFVKNRLYRIDEQEGLTDLYVYKLLYDERIDATLAVSDGGIARIERKDTSVKVQVFDTSTGLPDNIIKQVIPLNGSTYMIATEDGGIFEFDLTTSRSTRVTQHWSFGSITDFLREHDHLWIATAHGLVVYNLKEQTSILYNDKDFEGLLSTRTLFNDTEGNIWVGTRSSLIRTTGTILRFVNPELSDRNILAVTADHSGRIWFSNSKGLFNYSQGVIISFNLKTKLKVTTPVISLFTDVHGFVWAGLYGEGAVRIDPTNGEVLHFTDKLRNGNVLNITGDKNAVWFATLGGATKLNLETFEPQHFNSTNGLSTDFIYQVYLDKQGRVWFATDGKGVDMLDGSTIRNFEQGLPSKVVYSICEDQEGKIWANVQGHGMYGFDGAASFTRPSSVLSAHQDINAVTTDASGNMLLLHDAGLSIINMQSNLIRLIGEESGMRDKVGNLNAFAGHVNGDLYFATSDGIVMYTNGRTLLDHKPKATLISVKLFDKIVEPETLTNLSYDENNLTINFSGLWFTQPNDLYYQYQLDDFNEGWVSTRDNFVTYSKLPPGDYTFKVQVSETSNFKNASEAQVKVSIRYPFWKTVPFYFFVMLVAVVSSYLIIRYRERRLLRDKLILEARVKQRTTEIQRQHDEIRAQNDIIVSQAEEIKGINENLEMLVHDRTAELERKNKALEEYAFINAHKLRSPVASILGLVHLIGKTSLDDEGKEISRRLSQSADELDDIVRSITKAIERGDKVETRK